MWDKIAIVDKVGQKCSKRKDEQGSMNAVEKLTAILATHNLDCGLIVNAKGEVLAKVGNFEPFTSSGFADPYLADPKLAFDALQCQVLPAFTARAGQFVLRDKPNVNLMVMLFGGGVRSALQQFKLSREVYEAVRREFGTWCG